MIALRLVNVDECYWFVEEYNTIGGAYNRLLKLRYSTHIKCIGMIDEFYTPLPPHIVEAYNNQLPSGDLIYRYDKYPCYIKIKKGE